MAKRQSLPTTSSVSLVFTNPSSSSRASGRNRVCGLRLPVDHMMASANTDWPDSNRMVPALGAGSSAIARHPLKICTPAESIRVGNTVEPPRDIRGAGGPLRYRERPFLRVSATNVQGTTHTAGPTSHNGDGGGVANSRCVLFQPFIDLRL